MADDVRISRDWRGRVCWIELNGARLPMLQNGGATGERVLSLDFDLLFVRMEQNRQRIKKRSGGDGA